MNKTRRSPRADDAGHPALRPTGTGAVFRTSRSPRDYRPIRVGLFLDSRHVDPHVCGQGLHRGVQRRALDAPDTVTADRVEVTELFVSALQRAGYHVLWGPLGSDSSPPANVRQAVLQGRIWSFDFETHATSVLNVDLSLTLYDWETSEVLWRSDFPVEDSLPLWIGLGCHPKEMVRAALREVEEVAMLQFRSAQFCNVVRLDHRSRKLAAGKAEVSHEVVPGVSWTGSEEGQITAKAYESSSSAQRNEAPGSDVSEPAPRSSSREMRKAAGVAETQ